MSEYAYVLSMAFCFLILVTIEFKYSSSLTGTGALGRYMSHKGKYGIPIMTKINLYKILENNVVLVNLHPRSLFDADFLLLLLHIMNHY